MKRQLGTATKTLEDTGKRTRALERQLRTVELLPEVEASQLLALPTLEGVVEDEEPIESEAEAASAVEASNNE